MSYDSFQADNGGWLSVAEGCTASFQGEVDVSEYAVRSDTDGSDFSDDQWDGGCVWNQVIPRTGLTAREETCREGILCGTTFGQVLDTPVAFLHR